MGALLAFVGLFAVGAWLLSQEGDGGGSDAREIWLVPGARYSLLISARVETQADRDAIHSQLTSMGFVVEQFDMLPPGGLMRILAYWGHPQPTLWQVPENVSVDRVS